MPKQGSLTVEAAMVVPLILMVFGIAMRSGIQMYTECKDTAVILEAEDDFNAVKSFRDQKKLEDMIKNED